ncbi:RapH N-terminal domain-containing protein [Sporolactobacillus pectinivorans]|uniref:response regulator aspartate phosphatase n=1 Tax=Sporolactobacillus pectinivorans TaxID=1591408 RepID=UPI000C269ED5|nr:RapH N-terminal domain-containing protein [Sporolactobacillus pectinivorans]
MGRKEEVNTKISSIQVADKMNEWYRAIQNYEVEKSHQLQREIKQLLNHMEEDQTVLLYYSLLDFRMRLNDENPEQKEKATKTLKSIDNNEEQLTGILNYYYWFFKGMYEFKGHNYSAAISSYKVAEKRVEELNDDIEKAEYYHIYIMN